jgi:hypothetical protein
MVHRNNGGTIDDTSNFGETVGLRERYCAEGTRKSVLETSICRCDMEQAISGASK